MEVEVNLRNKLVASSSALLALLLIATAGPIPSYGQAGRTPTPTRRAATPTTTSVVVASPTATQTPAPTPTPESTDRFFPETGFTVPRVFMKYWDANGGLPVFGYPISEARTEVNLTDGREYMVQYFERNRFEHHPEFSDTPNEVLLGLLGAELTRGRTFETVEPFADTPDMIYMEPTKHSLGEPFLSYWRKNGGLAIFGYPISEPFQEKSETDGNTYVVQYFQRNRFEHHPGNEPPYDVLLGLLGKDFMEMQSLLTAWGPPIPGGLKAEQPLWKPAKPAAGGSYLKGPHVGDGMIAQLYYQDRERILNLVNDLDFGWVTQQVEWKDTETPKGVYYWDELDKIVDAAQRNNVKVMLSVVKAPSWATGSEQVHGFPKDPQDLGDFMRAMATHFKGRVQAYTIWNEQNLTGESGEINPGRYVELLKAGYLGVKSVDASAIVLSGALSPTGVNDPFGRREPGAMGAIPDTLYLEEMYKYNNGEVRAYFDVLGSHPYGFNNPPDTKWPDNPNWNPDFPLAADGKTNWYNRHNSFYFRRIEEHRAIMERYGDGQKQLWITEYGWCSDVRPDGYGECKYVTKQQQGEYIVGAMQRARKYYPWMGVMFLWNLNFSTFQPWYTGPSHFSILNGDWTGRPAYFTIKNRPRNP
jgi:polysaccharide biosynthesis protein PslG